MELLGGCLGPRYVVSPLEVFGFAKWQAWARRALVKMEKKCSVWIGFGGNAIECAKHGNG